MSEADRVFARMTMPGSHPAPQDKQFLHIASRKRGGVAGQSRMVEVVRRRSDRATSPMEPEHPASRSAYAATWPEGFHARSAPIPRPDDNPTASAGPALAVGHVMPGWEPLLPPLQPAEPAAKVQAGIRRQSPAAKSEQSEDPPMLSRRAFADPFAADDTGANCIRCGYLVSPAREKRGLMTCAQCR